MKSKNRLEGIYNIVWYFEDKQWFTTENFKPCQIFHNQVVQLHAELEQERSKNSALKSEIAKVRNKLEV